MYYILKTVVHPSLYILHKSCWFPFTKIRKLFFFLILSYGDQIKIKYIFFKLWSKVENTWPFIILASLQIWKLRWIVVNENDRGTRMIDRLRLLSIYVLYLILILYNVNPNILTRYCIARARTLCWLSVFLSIWPTIRTICIKCNNWWENMQLWICVEMECIKITHEAL